MSISPSRPSSELGGRRGYRRYRPESRDVSRARPCNTDPRRASARRVDRAARTRPRRAAPAHSRSGLGEFAPTCARGSARRTPAPLTPCLHAERAVQSPVDVRAETREARLEVRRQLRAAALEPRVARATRGKQQNTGIGQSWYRLKSVFGVILLNLRKAKVEPTKSRIPDQGVCVFTAREKHDTYPYRTRTAFLCQTNAHVFFSDPTLESKHYLLISLSPSRGQALLIHLTAHLILVVWIAAIIRRLTRFRCILCSFYV